MVIHGVILPPFVEPSGRRGTVVQRSAASRSMAVSGWTKWVTSAMWTPTCRHEF